MARAVALVPAVPKVVRFFKALAGETCLPVVRLLSCSDLRVGNS